MKQTALRRSAETMAEQISAVLARPLCGFWLYGSVVLDDFRIGWSDIDCIAITEDPITEEQAKALVTLRQTLSAQHPENPYFRAFEGVIVNRREYTNGVFSRLVYWGTSGQRVTDRFCLDPFARYELLHDGVCVCGSGDCSLFRAPAREELIAAIRLHLDGIRRCAVETDDSLYSCGWLLDIARCVYMLRFDAVISKTGAGEWALSERIFPDDEPLKRTLAIRRDPLQYKNDPDAKAWLRSLGPTVQRYADVLAHELDRVE